MNTIKPIRFLWRFSRNALCLIPAGQNWLFPPEALSERFGRSDADYAWDVFSHHLSQLDNAGFKGASRILEVGPGRNLGTALLWWSFCVAGTLKPPEIICWDVFRNANPEAKEFWVGLALALLEKFPGNLPSGDASRIRQILHQVADRCMKPVIVYRVASLAEMEAEITRSGTLFNLVYSQAAIEHIWRIDTFWEVMKRLTAPAGWHSHRIDLADHGKRETNYIELLEWSRLGYWSTMRFIPGATNRWRAKNHIGKLEDLGFRIMKAKRERMEILPIPLRQVSGEFRALGEEELRTTAIDLVAMNGETHD